MELILITITLFVLILASYTDLRTREVPDWISYSYISTAFAIVLIYSLQTDFTIFLYSLIGFAIMFALGVSMYYLKQWGGADAKLFMGLGIVFPVLGLKPAIVLLIAMLFIGGFYSFIWGLTIYLKNFKQSNKKFFFYLKKYKKTRFILVILSLIILISTFFMPIGYRIPVFGGLLIILLLFYLTVFIKTVEAIGFLKLTPLSQVTEGDWLERSVKLHNKILVSKSKACLTKKDIQLLKKNKIQEVWIKIGIPFVPVILLSTITAVIVYFMGF